MEEVYRHSPKGSVDFSLSESHVHEKFNNNRNVNDYRVTEYV